MGQLFTKEFWSDTFERSVSTSAQSVLLVAGLSDDGLSVINQGVNVTLLVYAALGGFLLTVVKCLAASYTGDKDSASLIE